MTEASVTQDLLTCLKRQLPGAVIFKTSDRITKGVPDICITWRGAVTWLEVKLLRKGQIDDRLCPLLQRHTLTRLAQESGGRGWYVIYDVRSDRRTIIVTPAGLADPLTMDDPSSYHAVHQVIKSGRVAVPGFDHLLVAQVIHRQAEVD